MNKLLTITLLLIAIVFNANAQQTDITKVLKFTNDNYDMGKIAFGKPTEFTVSIENISASPVILTNVQVGCGCTTPKFTANSVIAPGAIATVVLGFNGSAIGNFTKSATLFFNDNMVKTVSFHGEGIQQ